MREKTGLLSSLMTFSLTSWQAARLFKTFIFPMTESLRKLQELKIFWTYKIFSWLFKVKVSFGWRGDQTPRAFTLDLGHLKSLPVRRISFLRQFSPIQKASLLSLRPETL